MSRLRFVGFLALIVLALRPDPRLDAALDALLAPTRVLAELAQPVALLGRSEALAAEAGIQARVERERKVSRALASAERRFARPTDGALLRGRQFVHAEVVGRPADDLDEVHVRVAGGSTAGLTVGLPVVTGNVFVGRIRALDEPWPGHARVELVTGRDFNIGARIVDPSRSSGTPVRLVVGGLVARREREDVRLAFRSPSRRGVDEGDVVVDESLALERFGHAARGFRLGRLDGDGLRPELDYESGLSQVVVVVPDERSVPTDAVDPDPFSDGGWIGARRLASADPSPWRRSAKVGAGTWNGVEPGAAVVYKTRLVGRVARSGALVSDVVRAPDRDFFVSAVARIAGREEPLALGRLWGRGRSPNGRLVLEWAAVVPLPADVAGGTVAELFTGAGEPTVPAGLAIGATHLPAGDGPHRLEVDDGGENELPRKVWIRLPRGATARGADA